MNIIGAVSSYRSLLIFRALKREMADCSLRLVGFDRNLVGLAKKEGMNYSAMPIFGFAGGCVQRENWPVHQYWRRGLFENRPSARVIESMTAFRSFVRAEILSSANLRVAVVINTGELVDFCLSSEAKAIGVPVISLHTSFMQNVFILNYSGLDFSEIMSRDACRVPADFSVEPVLRNGAFFYGDENARRVHKLAVAERIVRLLPFAYRLDSLRSFLSSVLVKLYKPGWLLGFRTLFDLDDIRFPYVVVVMHSPVDLQPDMNWKTLLEFSAKAIPRGFSIVIRPHPGELPPMKTPGDVVQLFAGRDVYVSRVSVGPGIDAIVRNSVAVITIGSALGVEALMLGRPVFSLSRTFYTMPGGAELVDLDDHEKINFRLRSGEVALPDQLVVREMIEFILENCSLPNPIDSELGARWLAKVVNEVGNEL